MKSLTSEYSLPFDQFSRQGQVLEVIDALRKNDESFKILDVGGYKGATTQLHKNDKVTVIDVFDVVEDGYIKGDGNKLPFKDREFDFVVSFDVLEHIPKKSRDTFLKESIRVASRAIVTAAPVYSEANSLAEHKLNQVYKKLHGDEHRWLREHIEYGLPNVDKVEQTLKSKELEVLKLPSNDTLLWFLMQSAIFMTSKFTKFVGELEKLNKLYNKLGPFDGSAEPSGSYRNIFIGFKDSRDAMTVQKLISSRTTSLSVSKTKMDALDNITNFYLQAITSANDELAESRAKTAEDEGKIKAMKEEIARLEDALKEIRQSKSYKVARRIAKVKHGIWRS